MINSKTSKEQNTQSNNLQAGVVGYITMGVEDSNRLAIDAYLRVERMMTGDAVHADRQTLLIRINAGLHRLEDFECEGGDALVREALRYVSEYRPQAKKEMRRINDEKATVLKEALNLIDQAFEQSTLWEQVQAYKYGEDKCLIASNETEYVLITVH